MFHCIQTLRQRRRRRQRAAIIQKELARAGYSARDLKHLAMLRATVDVAPLESAPLPAPRDPSRPTLADVLQVWEPAAPPPGWGMPRTTLVVDDAELMQIQL